MARPSGIPGPQAYRARTLSLSYISALNKLLQALTVLWPSTWPPSWWPSVLLPVEGLENARLPLFWFILLMCRSAEKNKPGAFVCLHTGLQLVPTLGSSLCWLLGRQAELEISFPEVPQTDSHSPDGGLPFTESKDSSLMSLAARWQLLASLFLLTPGLGTQREPHQPTPKILFSYLCLPFLTPGRWEEEKTPDPGISGHPC